MVEIFFARSRASMATFNTNRVLSRPFSRGDSGVIVDIRGSWEEAVRSNARKNQTAARMTDIYMVRLVQSGHLDDENPVHHREGSSSGHFRSTDQRDSPRSGVAQGTLRDSQVLITYPLHFQPERRSRKY